MKNIVLAVSLSLAMGTAVAEHHEFDDRWYVTPNVSFQQADGDKNVNSGLAYGVGFGRFLTEKISLDLEYSRAVLEAFNGDDSRNLDENAFDLMGRYHFNDQKGFRPFVGLGVGFLRNDKPTKFNPTLSLAAGLTKELTDRVKLRTELKYRLQNSHTARFGSGVFRDFFFSTGLNIALGDVNEQKTVTQLVEQSPQLDSDNDGVSDANDRCPNSPQGSRVDATGCAIKVVDGDDDGDGVANSRDACPRSAPGDVVGSDGCKVNVVIELQGVYFDTDKSTLKPESIAILNSAVKTLGTHGTILVEVAGHTDSTASESYNQRLSERRAKVVYEYLVNHGVSADRMTWKGYGEMQPIANNATEEGKARNRRTELIVQ